MNQEIFNLVKEAQMPLINAAVQKAVDAGESPLEIMDTMTEAMAVVGEGFRTGELFIPEMLMSAMTMQSGAAILKPYLAGNASKLGKFIMGTVYGDLHDVGKNLVIMMIEAAGYEVVDLGIDVSVEKFVSAVENDPEVNLVGVSALLTTTMPAMEKVVEALNACKRRSEFKIMIGGAPINQDFCDRIGADAYTPDAASAADKAKALA